MAEAADDGGDDGDGAPDVAESLEPREKGTRKDRRKARSVEKREETEDEEAVDGSRSAGVSERIKVTNRARIFTPSVNVMRSAAAMMLRVRRTGVPRGGRGSREAEAVAWRREGGRGRPAGREPCRASADKFADECDQRMDMVIVVVTMMTVLMTTATKTMMMLKVTRATRCGEGGLLVEVFSLVDHVF